MKSVNLIPAPRLQAKRRRVRLRWWVAVCVTYVLVLAAVYVGCRFRWDTVQSADNTEMVTVTDEISDYNRKIAAMKGTVQSVRMKIEANRAIGSQPDWSVLLALIAKNLGTDVVLKHCKLDLAGPSHGAGVGQVSSQSRKEFMFEVTGLGRSQTAVSQFVLRLEQAGLFSKVKLIRTHREQFLESKAVGFQLACSLGAESRRLK